MTDKNNDNYQHHLRRLVELLEQQYDGALEYCNALTFLHNTTATDNKHDNDDDKGAMLLHMAWEDVLHKTCRVQQQYQDLQMLVASSMAETTDIPVSFYFALKQHQERTQRILKAIFEQGNPAKYSTHGIPLALSASKTTTDMQTLALATLRASCQEVLELLGPLVSITVSSSSS